MVAAAGGLPAEVTANWRTLDIGTVDVEFGFSCMGYEIAGAWGARIAQAQMEPDQDVITFCGDGSYMMLNSDIYSSVLSAKKMIVLVLDNGGFAVINKLQNNTGNESFNNLLADCPTIAEPFGVDFVAHAASMGAAAEKVSNPAELGEAFKRAKASDKTYVIVMDVDHSKVLFGYSIVLLALYLLLKPVYLKSAIYLMSIWALGNGLTVENSSNIFTERSFFGISRVNAEQTDEGLVHVFVHGNTVHNRQLRGAANETYPLSYYAPEGSFGQAVDAVRADKGALKVAAIGLGAGALACHIQDGEKWTFYEIDPLVEKMARDPKLFSYIEKCAPDVPIKIGDARLTLAEEAKGTHDLIIVDAFSSDAIPAHLMTQESLALYQSLLKEDGFVFFHTSNRNLDVTSVAINVAQASGLGSRAIYFQTDETMKHHKLVNSSAAVMVGRDASLDRIFKGNPDWKKRKGNPIVGVWSDDFTHILGAYLANYVGNKE